MTKIVFVDCSLESKGRKGAAVGIIRTVINDVPNEIYQTNYNRDREQQYKKIISKHYKNKHKKDFQDLGITLPEGYP